jgi:hypothetical protein
MQPREFACDGEPATQLRAFACDGEPVTHPRAFVCDDEPVIQLREFVCDGEPVLMPFPQLECGHWQGSMQGNITTDTNDTMGLTFDALLSRVTGMMVALICTGGILLVRAERLTGVALIPVDTLRTLNYMTTIMSTYRESKRG